MSLHIKEKNSSDLYKQRFVQYGQNYIDSWPEPDPMLMKPQGTNPDMGAQKGALNRQVRYNDKSTTQNSTVTGGSNGKV